MKNYIKIVIDIIMLALFLYLMSYHAGQGLLLHALLGIGIFVLFIIHHLLNLNWYKSMFRGKYHFRRILLSVSDHLLLISMLMMMLSSFMISGLVFDVSFLPVRFYWRDIHVAATAWSFILMAFHLAVHLHGLLKQIGEKLKKMAFEYVWYLLLLLAFSCGAYCYVINGLWFDMMMVPQSIPVPEFPLFYLEYTAVIISITVLTHAIISLYEFIMKRRKPV